MNSDSINLLKECNAGCKSAVNSMRQIKEYVVDERLTTLIDKYTKKYEHLGEKFHEVLNEHSEPEKDPNTMVAAFASMGTEIKLMLNNEPHRVAKLLMDGCNMAIKSISDYVMQYDEADEDSVKAANDLIDIAVDFMKDLEEC